MPDYYALGRRHPVTLVPLDRGPAAIAARRAGMAAVRGRPAPAALAPASIATAMNASEVLRARVEDPSRLMVVQGSVPARRAAASVRRAAAIPISTPGTVTLATETVIAEGLRQGDFTAAKNFGARVIEEGLDGKILLRVD